MTTTNLADFDYYELAILTQTLEAYRLNGLPVDFIPDGVVPMLNTSSGNVFLTNSEYQVAMLNGSELESWYFLSYSGIEGFLDELLFDYDNNDIPEEDFEELASICEINGFLELAEEIRNKLKED